MSRRDVLGAGLLAPTGAGLRAPAGCGVVADEPRRDTRSAPRPGTRVRRLEESVAELRAAAADMVVKATSAQRRRAPRIGSEPSRLAAATAAMKDDLERQPGRSGENLGETEAAARSIDDRLTGARVAAAGRSARRDTAHALGSGRELDRTLGPDRRSRAEQAAAVRRPRGHSRLLARDERRCA